MSSGFFGPGTLVALSLLTAMLVAVLLPSGLETCRQSHSFETCHHVLYR